MISRLRYYWGGFWMRFSGQGFAGRLASRIAGWPYRAYKGRHALARLGAGGYISPRATLAHPNLTFGQNIFVGDGVILFSKGADSKVFIGDDVYINQNCIIETGYGGSLRIDDRTTIQPGCQFSCYRGPITIGKDVQVAPNCAFYPYNHQFVAGKPIKGQPLVTKGGIVIQDDVWLGYGVIVLDGVTIGQGAVIGAGSVVTKDIEAGFIAAGVPAKALSRRSVVAEETPA